MNHISKRLILASWRDEAEDLYYVERCQSGHRLFYKNDRDSAGRLLPGKSIGIHPVGNNLLTVEQASSTVEIVLRKRSFMEISRAPWYRSQTHLFNASLSHNEHYILLLNRGIGLTSQQLAERRTGIQLADPFVIDLNSIHTEQNVRILGCQVFDNITYVVDSNGRLFSSQGPMIQLKGFDRPVVLQFWKNLLIVVSRAPPAYCYSLGSSIDSPILMPFVTPTNLKEVLSLDILPTGDDTILVTAVFRDGSSNSYLTDWRLSAF